MIDFASGSGHFLTTYMQELQYQINQLNASDYHLNKIRNRIKNWQARGNDYTWASNYVYGIEIDYRLVKTAKIDTYLNGDGDANIIHANALDSFRHLNQLPLKGYSDNGTSDHEFDILISNPPYSVKHFIRNVDTRDFPYLGNLFTDKSNEIQLLFIERATQLLRDGGYLAIVLPSTFLTTANKLYVKARQLFLSNFEIRSITALPSITFFATGSNTVLILAKKRKMHEVASIQNQIRSALKNNQLNVTIYNKTNLIRNFLKLSKTSSNKLLNDWHKGTKTKRNNILNEIKAFALSTQKICIIKPKSSKKVSGREFLGYKFSNSRGNEGIHSISKGYHIYQLTCLYGNKHHDRFLDYINRQMFLKLDNDELDIPSKMSKLVQIKVINLNKLINFKKQSININKRSFNGLGFSKVDNNISLEKIADIKPGKSILESDTQRGNYPVIAGGMVSPYTIDHPNRKGNIITISQSGASAGYISYHEDPIFASDCFTIRANNNSSYTTLELFYLLKMYQNEIYEIASGSDQPHVYAKDLYDFKLPILNDTQYKSLANDVTKYKAMRESDSSTKKYLVKELHNLSINALNAGTSYTIRQLKHDKVLDLRGGKRIPKSDDYVPPIIKTNHYYPQVKNFVNYSIDLKYSRFINNNTYEKIKHYALKKNDVFISIAGTIGKVGMMPNIPRGYTVSLTENAARFTNINKNTLLPKFLMIEICGEAFHNEIKTLMSHNDTPKLGLSMLESCTISIPSLKTQLNYCDKFESLINKLNATKNRLNTKLNTDKLF